MTTAMESSDIKVLKRQRACIKSQLTRVQTYLDDHPEASSAALETRQAKLEQMFESFSEIQINIESRDMNVGEWHSFHDTFKSLVHDNEELIGVQKFHLLKNVLRGEATAVIDSLNATEGNYLVAWNLLCKRCNKPRKIINAHLRRLFDLPEVNRDTIANLRQLIEQAQVHVNALQAINQPIEHWDTILIHVVSGKLDKNTCRAWERTLEDEEIPKFKQLVDFVSKHARGDDLGTDIVNLGNTNNRQDNLRPRIQARGQAYISTKARKHLCVICEREHPMYTCPKFLELSVRDRLDIVKKSKLCINCLQPNHIVINCRVGTCQKCEKKHHTLLHFSTETQGKANNRQVLDTPSTSVENLKTALTVSYDSEVLLGTVRIIILDKHNKEHTCRVLLDSGSQTHFITHRLAERLQLDKREINLSFSGLGQINTAAKYLVKTGIKSQHGPFNAQVTFMTLPSITGMLPLRQVNISELEIPGHIQLADPDFYKPSEIDALIGNALFYNLLETGQIRLKKTLAILQNTQLGWIVTAEIDNPRQNNSGKVRVCHVALHTQQNVDFMPHFELATDSSTESCLETLKRFRAREEKSPHLDLDSGTNFVVAKNEIVRAQAVLLSNEHEDKTRQFLTQRRVEWYFSPPRSPHFGGLWAAIVKAFKVDSRKPVGDAIFTDERFNTLIVEIRAIVNSRSVTPMSSDPNHSATFSPSRTLIGDSLACLLEHKLVDNPINKLSLWQYRRKSKPHWKGWKPDYLQELHFRNKWHIGDATRFKEGTLATNRSDNAPPLHWQLGRLLAAHPGGDDVIRVVAIRTPHGIISVR